jgi:hypothetical protein
MIVLSQFFPVCSCLFNRVLLIYMNNWIKNYPAILISIEGLVSLINYKLFRLLQLHQGLLGLGNGICDKIQ